MSSIGPSNPAALNLAGSFAGAQRTSAQQDEAQAQQAAQRFQVDQSDSNDQDVAEADMDADRDADGRQGYYVAAEDQQSQQSDPETGGDSAPGGSVKHAPDAFGERGTRLDLDA